MGWMHGPNVEHIPSQRHSPLTTDDHHPIGIVWHYTATDYGTGRRLATRIQQLPGEGDRAASWHLLCCADGAIFQSVPFTLGAWHVRKQCGELDGNVINYSTVGIELEGYGEKPSQRQIDAARFCMYLLARKYSIAGDRLHLTHAEYDPGRKTDPGPAWEAILERCAAQL